MSITETTSSAAALKQLDNVNKGEGRGPLPGPEKGKSAHGQ
jgi:hypothetical protein